MKPVGILIIAGMLVAGAGAGFLIGQIAFPKNDAIDYSKLSDVDFEDDNTLLMKKYATTKTDDYSKVFKPYELANITTEKFKAHDYVVSKTTGEVKAMGVTQTVRSSVIKNKDEYFMENISSSPIIQTAKRFYQSGNSVTTYNGNNAETDKANWDEDSKETLSLEEHEQKWGKNLSRPFIYIISSKTVLDTSVTTKDESGYVVNVDLHPKYAVLRYVRQMLSISPIKDPVFESITLKMHLDKNLNLMSMDIEEKYSVVMVIPADSVASIKETYTYNEKTEIPDLKTNITY